MKKLISIGVVLALLAMVVLPAAVAADYPEDPGTYSKTPFGILGTGIELIGEVVTEIPFVADMIADYVDVPAVTELVGSFVGVNLAWMTDMTAWIMVLVGDVLKTALGLDVVKEFVPVDLTGVEEIFYVIGARVWDAWEEVLPDAVTTGYPPTLP